MNCVKSVAAVVCLSTLTACGAGGGVGSLIAPLGSGPITTNEVQSWTQKASYYENLTIDDVTLAVPNVASASYNGLMFLEHDFNSELLGRVQLDANFAGGTVSGQAGDFAITTFDPDMPNTINTAEVLSGTLTINNGTITDTDMAADIAGSLGSNAGNYGVAGQLDGEFYDIAGEGVVVGLVDGTLTHPDAAQNDLFGAFMAFQE